MPLLLQVDPTTWNWSQFGMAAGVLFLVVVFFIFLLKIVPMLASTYERIKGRELDVREKEGEARIKEAESRIQQANGFSQLAGALTEMSGVIKEVVIDQRHETSKAILMSRVSAESSEHMVASIAELSEDVSYIKKALEGNKNGAQTKSTPTN